MTVIKVTYELNKFIWYIPQENVEPATYSISATFNKNRDRTSHNTGKVPFQSRQPKCTERISDNPGTWYLLPSSLLVFFAGSSSALTSLFSSFSLDGSEYHADNCGIMKRKTRKEKGRRERLNSPAYR